jgi:hypothetical protein
MVANAQKTAAVVAESRPRTPGEIRSMVKKATSAILGIGTT